MATGKGMPDVAEPAVIDAEMCRECIYIPPSEDGSESKSKRDEAREEVHFHEVDTLIFSFKSILFKMLLSLHHVTLQRPCLVLNQDDRYS